VSAFAPPVQRLITELSKLPGIGGRTAQRLAFHVLRSSDEEAAALAEAIREVKARIGLCEVCFNLADGPRCRICQDERREAGIICVVEEPGDVIPIDPEDLKIAELYARVTNGDRPTDAPDPHDAAAVLTDEPVREVVIATNPTTTGEATALHLAAGLRERRPELTVTRLASGLPVGADLEYADELTLGRAFAGRRAI
jgi:recombination protein RecR